MGSAPELSVSNRIMLRVHVTFTLASYNIPEPVSYGKISVSTQAQVSLVSTSRAPFPALCRVHLQPGLDQDLSGSPRQPHEVLTTCQGTLELPFLGTQSKALRGALGRGHSRLPQVSEVGT